MYKYWQISIIIFSLLAFVGCGETGRYVNTAPNMQQQTPTPLTNPNIINNNTNNNNTGYNPCIQLTETDGTTADATLTTMFTGISACLSTNQTSMVKLLFPSNFPSNTALCVVPATEYTTGVITMYTPVCSTVTSSQQVFQFSLSSNLINKVIVMRQQDYSQYVDYINFVSDTAPTRALGLLSPQIAQ